MNKAPMWLKMFYIIMECIQFGKHVGRWVESGRWQASCYGKLLAAMHRQVKSKEINPTNNSATRMHVDCLTQEI